ncbi:glutathione S-transferase theta-1 [Sergentomyia squamirostris]
MSTNLKFYSNLMSQPGRSLYIVMKLAKIPFESITIALREGEHATESFAKEINALKTIPCINDGGFKLAESIAILRYLATKSSLIVRWYPGGARTRARVDEYLEWHHLNVRGTLANYFSEAWLQPLLTKQAAKPEKLAVLRAKMIKSLDVLENLWLRNGDFIANNEVSVADIWAICEIEQLALANFDVTEGRPGIKAWMERVRKACNPFYDEAHEILWKTCHKYGQKTPKL